MQYSTNLISWSIDTAQSGNTDLVGSINYTEYHPVLYNPGIPLTYAYMDSCCADTGLPSDCNKPEDTTLPCPTFGYQASYTADDVPDAVGEGISKTIIATAGFAGAITLVGIIRLAMLLL
jgi:hypothetical protein